MKSYLLFLSLFGIGLSASAQSLTISTYTPSTSNGDSYVISSSPSATNGASTTMYVDVTTVSSSSSIRRAFVHFDLGISFPSNAIVESATLRLTPNGTDALGATTDLTLSVCKTTWVEGTLNYAAGTSGNANVVSQTNSTFNSSTNKREFDVREQVQAMFDNRVPNFGFMIRRSDESTLSASTLGYFTKEGTTKPQLEIKYYLPTYVSAASIVHATTTTSLDGSISPTLARGATSSRSYYWYDASGTLVSTSLNLTGVKYGWYGLKVVGNGTLTDISYQAFLIGVQCQEVAIDFNPGPDYIDDALLGNLTIAGIIDNKQVNGGGSLIESASDLGAITSYGKTALKFKVWVDPNFAISSSQMTLFGNGHNPGNRPNSAELQRFTAGFREYGICYNTIPTSSSSDKILIPNTPAGNDPSYAELSTFFNIWKTNNVANYGMLFQLQSYTNSQTSMIHHSSDAVSSSSRPSINFKVSLISGTCSCYSELKRKLDGGIIDVYSGKLRFTFDEEYKTENTYLPFKIYNKSHQVMASSTKTGTVTGGVTPLSYQFDDGRYLLNLSGVSGMVVNDYYTLEVSTQNGEKYYLKFIYK